MSAPRPAPTDLLGLLNYVADGLDEIRATQGERRVSARAAAEALGYSASYLHGKPWRIPDFGRSGTLHALSAWRAWLDRPEVDRRREWDLMPAAARRKARGIA